MFDERFCWQQATTADEAYKYLKSNFIRHYARGSAPFPIHGHANNLLTSNVERTKGITLFNFLLNCFLFFFV